MDHLTDSDEALAEKAAVGDRDAYGALYERYLSSLHDFVFRMLRDRELAADVIQESFAKAWEAIQRKPAQPYFKTWIFTIARNLALDELRRRKRFSIFRQEQAEDDERHEEFASLVQDQFPDPEAAAHQREIAEVVWSAARALSPKEYSLLDLHVRQGLSVTELASCLDLQQGNVRTMLSRLRDSPGGFGSCDTPRAARNGMSPTPRNCD